MEEMTEIVTTFYNLEGASKGIAMERWDWSACPLYKKQQPCQDNCLALNKDTKTISFNQKSFVKTFIFRAESIFKQLDSNGDGSLDEEEFCK